jgi:hypothetical protein
MFPDGFIREQRDWGEFLVFLDAYTSHLKQEAKDRAMILKESPGLTPYQINAQIVKKVEMRNVQTIAMLTTAACPDIKFTILFKKVLEDLTEMGRVPFTEGRYVLDQDTWCLLQFLSHDGKGGNRNGLNDNKADVKWVYCARPNCDCPHIHPHSGRAPPTRKCRIVLAELIRKGRMPIMQLLDALLELYLTHSDTIGQMRLIMERGGIEVSEKDITTEFQKKNRLSLHRIKALSDLTDEEASKVAEMTAADQHHFLRTSKRSLSLLAHMDKCDWYGSEEERRRIKRRLFSSGVNSRSEANKKARADGDNLDQYAHGWLTAKKFRQMLTLLRENPTELPFSDVLRIINLYRTIATVSRARRYADHGFPRISLGLEDSLLDNIAYNMCYFTHGCYVCPNEKYMQVAKLMGDEDWERREFCSGGNNCTHGVHLSRPHADFSRMFKCESKRFELGLETTESVLASSYPGYVEAKTKRLEAFKRQKAEIEAIELSGYTVTKDTKTRHSQENRALKRAMEATYAEFKHKASERVLQTCTANRYVYTPDSCYNAESWIKCRRKKVAAASLIVKTLKANVLIRKAKATLAKLRIYHSPEQVAIREAEAAARAAAEEAKRERQRLEDDARATALAKQEERDAAGFYAGCTRTHLDDVESLPSKKEMKRLEKARRAREAALLATSDASPSEDTRPETSSRKKSKGKRSTATMAVEDIAKRGERNDVDLLVRVEDETKWFVIQSRRKIMLSDASRGGFAGRINYKVTPSGWFEAKTKIHRGAKKKNKEGGGGPKKDFTACLTLCEILLNDGLLPKSTTIRIPSDKDHEFKTELSRLMSSHYTRPSPQPTSTRSTSAEATQARSAPAPLTAEEKAAREAEIRKSELSIMQGLYDGSSSEEEESDDEPDMTPEEERLWKAEQDRLWEEEQKKLGW